VQLETPTRSSDRTALLNFCCEEKQTKTFTVAIDPGGQKLADYFSLGGVPLSMLLDRRMKIRYKIEGDPSGLEATLQDILAEP
jgi:hypothetical protein